MTNFEKIKSFDKEQLSEWLDKNGQFDGSQWLYWFDATYCGECDAEKISVDTSDGTKIFECSYCELHSKCRYFPEMPNEPSNKDIIKMWLKEESKDE